MVESQRWVPVWLEYRCVRPGPSEETVAINEKNAPLLNHLRTLYVESTDPAEPPQVSPGRDTHTHLTDLVFRVFQTRGSRSRAKTPAVQRPLAAAWHDGSHDVPKGKLTLAEALKALSSHQQQPHTWTAEKISQHYSLELRDCKALLNYFCPFTVQIIPPASAQTKRIKES
ncbi:hypothetical protein WMY93_015438 [Mugilogobius chulae]|uniref:NADH dehydrogenase [ubiquinone] 1 alpha subcomplex assembly factor 4 n=1 Tax=Mugilogobius chulae TaxID=88201 RepID=A0AAW0P0F1_9GOBI